MDILDYLGIETSTLVLIGIMIVCAWLLLRDVKTWYWKINELVRNQELQVEIMDEIVTELKHTNELLKANKKEEQTESTEEPNDKSTP